MKLLNNNTPAASNTFKSMLVYGETQSGKTSLLGTIARAHFEKTGKITRLILCDEGGPSAIMPEIRDGIIQVVDMVADEMPQSNLMWLAKGAFPGPDGKMDTKNAKLPDNVGIVALDSLTSAAALVMNWFVQTNQKVSSDLAWSRQEQGLTFGAASMSHYGAVQSFILQLTTQFSSLPVDMMIYTALEAKGEDSIDKTITLGPDIAGKKLTGVMPSRMNRILHLEIVPTADKKDRTYRIYFRPHVDATLGRVWPANLRVPLAVNEQLKANPKYANGYLDFKTGGELLELFEVCEGLTKVKELGEGEGKKLDSSTSSNSPTTGTTSTSLSQGLQSSQPSQVERIQSLTNKNIFNKK